MADHTRTRLAALLALLAWSTPSAARQASADLRAAPATAEASTSSAFLARPGGPNLGAGATWTRQDGPAAARGAAAPADVPPVRALDAEVEALRARHGVPALAGALVDREGRIVLGGVAGTTTAGGDVAPATDARWHVGSCGKAMTATLAALDVAAGRLAWDSSPAVVLAGLAPEDDPDWAIDPSWESVTLEQLLSHTAGAPTAEDLPLTWLGQLAHGGPPRAARVDLARALLARPTETEPGTAWRYSNLGYALAGAMLEVAGGRPFEERIRADLFAPLGGEGVGFGPPPGDRDPQGHRVRTARPANGADPAQGGDVVAYAPAGRGPRADNPAGIAPAGTLHLTLADWARFVGLHLRRGEGSGGPLGPESFEALHRPRRDGYALGWLVAERPWSEGPVLHHAGSNTMWFAVVWAAPTEGFAVLACTNAGDDAARAATDALATLLIERAGPR